MSPHREQPQVDSQGLHQGLRKRHMSLIALGGIIGAGLFVGSGSAIATAGPAASVAYLVGGLLVILVMRMLGEMATATPALGSFAAYAREALGSWAGFVVGWTYWYFWIVVVAFEATAGASIIHTWVPGMPLWTISLCLMLVMTAVNLLSVRSFGETEFWFASIKVLAVVAFIAIGIAFIAGVSGGSATGHPFSGEGGFAPHGVDGILSALVVVVFAYFGSEMITLAAAESKEPQRVVARATVSVVWRVLLFYVGSVVVIVAIVPWTQVPTDTSPFVTVLDRVGIEGLGTAMNVIILTAVLSLLNSGIYASSRMLFALASVGDASRRLSAVNGRGVPVAAILLGTVAGYGSVIFAYTSPDQIFTFLLNSTGAIALFLYLAIAVSQLRLRKRLEAEAPEKLTVRMWAYPYLTYASIALILAVIVTMGSLSNTREQLLTSLAGPAVIVAAYIGRMILRKTAQGPSR